MIFNGHVKVNGGALFVWAQRRKDGSVELVFEKNHAEAVLEFSADAWASVREAINILEAGGGNSSGAGLGVRNPTFDTCGKGEIEAFSVIINTWEDPLSFNFCKDDGDNFAEILPTIMARSAKSMNKKSDDYLNGDIELMLSIKDARQLRELLNRALEAHEAVKRLYQPKAAPVPAA